MPNMFCQSASTKTLCTDLLIQLRIWIFEYLLLRTIENGKCFCAMTQICFKFCEVGPKNTHLIDLFWAFISWYEKPNSLEFNPIYAKCFCWVIALNFVINKGQMYSFWLVDMTHRRIFVFEFSVNDVFVHKLRHELLSTKMIYSCQSYLSMRNLPAGGF